MSAIPLSKEDLAFLRHLNEDIWWKTTDRFGSIHAFPAHDRPVTAEERVRVLDLIRKHELPCMLSSGIYGNLSMVVADHVDVAGSGAPRVISLSSEHLGVNNLPWNDQYDFFAQFTHSVRNRELLAFYNLPTPQDRLAYEY